MKVYALAFANALIALAVAFGVVLIENQLAAVALALNSGAALAEAGWAAYQKRAKPEA